jgi:hypothetical protein
MNDPDPAFLNFAGGNAHVGVQAQNVDGGIAYATVVLGNASFTVPPGASAKEKYQVGLNNLASGMVAKARELIWDAMMEGYQTSSARFHWLVAMLSGRTIRQFSQEEVSRLEIARKEQPEVDSDPWTDGIRLIFRLLESVSLLQEIPKPDITTVIKEFDALGARQRHMLLPHLELFLDGPLKDGMWRRERASAEAGRLDGGRKNRAWMFFQPVPIGPRVREPRPPYTTSAKRLTAWASTMIFAGIAVYLGWELLRQGPVLGVLAYVAGLAGGAVAWVNGLELRFLIERRRMKDRQLRPPGSSAARPPRDGFAGKVDTLFRHYSAKYLPDTTERAAWEAATAGIRKLDRDEIVTEYRETRIPAERVAWLIRYRIRQSRDRWRDGTLYEHRNQLRPGTGLIMAFRAGVAIAIIGGIGAVAKLGAHPTADVASVIVGLSGIWMWHNWLKIELERRRHAADAEESRQRKADSELEFARWNRVLERRPTDAEIAAWLDCDRTALLGQAMDHYRLARSQVLTHAFLEEPGAGARRTRANNGPMRYSRYKIVVFLLTSDGVRQLTAGLSFVAITLRHLERISYRYDAVASAHVSLTSHAPEGLRIQQRFKLTLINGDPISAIVTDLDPEDFQQGEDADSLANATLDAASVANTLHVLEGIAAEGKSWFQERHAGHRRETDRRLAR